MKYVNMNEAAFDPDCIVFPGLGNCHGVVYVNASGLFAYHIFGHADGSLSRIGAFGMFVRNHVNGGAKGVCLYGACPSNRFTNGDKDHKKELKLVAEALKFDGPIKGCRWDIAKLHWGTTYCEYRCNRMKVTILIEDFTGGTFQRGANNNSLDHKILNQQTYSSGLAGIFWSSCKAPDDVITGVGRPAQASGQQIAPWQL
jgi:hypothetical protein